MLNIHDRCSSSCGCLFHDGSRPGPNTRLNERPSDTVYKAENEERERGNRESGVSGFD